MTLLMVALEQIVSYSTSTAAVVVNLTTGTASDGLGGTDRLISIEDVAGSSFNDSLTGTQGRTSLSVELAMTLLMVALEQYVVDYSSSTAAVNVNLATGTASDGLASGTDTLISIEEVIGSTFNGSLTGDAANNLFISDPGNDTVTGAMALTSGLLFQYSSSQR